MKLILTLILLIVTVTVKGQVASNGYLVNRHTPQPIHIMTGFEGKTIATITPDGVLHLADSVNGGHAILALMKQKDIEYNKVCKDLIEAYGIILGLMPDGETKDKLRWLIQNTRNKIIFD